MKISLDRKLYKDGTYVSGTLNIDELDGCISEAFKCIEHDTLAGDAVRGGRVKIKKGTPEMGALLNKDVFLTSLVEYINSKDFTDQFIKVLGVEEINGIPLFEFEFDKDGEIKSSFIDKIIRKLKPPKKVFWEFDFSCSREGYSRGPHLDSPNRIGAMLVYFTSLTEEAGGKFKFYGKVDNVDKKRDCLVSGSALEFIPKEKMILGFLSDNNSAHEATPFKVVDGTNRVFAYFCLSTHAAVNW
ncbi:MAG: hypothetical protein JXR18_12230 [Neptuniibacter sp.]